MFLKIFLFYFQKICFFFNEEKLKETMSRKESKFYVINFIDSQNTFFKNNILTQCTMKTHIQKSNKDSKLEVNNSLTDAQIHLSFLKVLCYTLHLSQMHF